MNLDIYVFSFSLVSTSSYYGSMLPTYITYMCSHQCSAGGLFKICLHFALGLLTFSTKGNSWK